MKHATTSTLLIALAISAIAVFFGTTPAAADEYRAFWVDAWHAGALNQAQVDKLLGVVGDPNSKGDIRNANCNAVFVQVRRSADVCYPSGMGEPYFSGLSPSNFNALQAVINAAHDTTGGKQRIEVHAWMVMFRTAGGAVYQAHNDTPTGSLTNLDNYWPTRMGSTTGAENSDKAFDPGHPLAEEYMVNVAMDVVNNFDIDGIHYDYIRFKETSGQPQSLDGYNPTSVARYNARYGLTGDPAAGDERWKQWRRDQITALVRKIYAKIQTVKPWVKQSGSFITWNPSPISSTRAAFQATRPYYDVYSDWDAWMQEGIMDIAVPMNYYDQASLPNDYVRWMNFLKDRKGNRHSINGPGIYKNYLQEAIDQILMTRDASPSGNYCQGWCGYSYFAPYADVKGTTDYGSWEIFSPELVAQVTPAPTNIPVMPWKTSPAKGHVSGTIYNAAAWVDGANVSITGPENRSQIADGTGFYAFIDLAPGTYAITVTSSLSTLNAGSIVVTAGNMTVKDFNYDDPTAIAGTVKDNLGNGIAGATVAATTGGYSTTTGSDGSYSMTGVAPGTYTVTASKPNHSSQTKYNIVVTDGATTTVHFTINPDAPVVSSVSAGNITQNSAVIAWTTNVPATSQVVYGQTRDPNTYTPEDAALVTSHSVTLTGLTQNRIYHYSVISKNSLGQSTVSSGYYFFTAAQGGVTSIIVDNTDPGFAITQGAWKTGNSGTLFYGSDYRFADTANSATSTCTWTPNIPTAGNYNVYVYYPSGSNRSTKAPYRIYYSGSNTTININQQINGGQWNLIASSLPFTAGSSGYIQLTNNTKENGRVVMADAVKFESLSPSDVTPPTVPTGLAASAVSTTQIQISWQPSTDASGIGGYKIYRNGVLIDATDGATSYTDFGLTPNTSCTYTVAAYDIYANTSAHSDSVIRATLCMPIGTGSITCDKPVSTWQTASDAFTFTNTVGFGGQTIDHIRHVWDRSPSHTWTDSETPWTSGTKTGNANPGGNDWYFHARAYNADNVPNGQVDLGPFYCDTTAPQAPVPTAAKYTVSTNQLSCSWTGADPESGVASYEYAIGTFAGGTDIKNWTSNGANTSVTASVSPELVLNQTYYFSVRSTNNAGLTGSAGNSAGTTAARACASIAEAKGYPNGSAVYITGRYVTYGNASGAYVQDPDRTAALYLPGVSSLTYGNIVDVGGILDTAGLDRILDKPEFVSMVDEFATVLPLGITCSNLGGGALNQWTPGIDGGIGLNTINLLVRSWGKVTASTSTYFTITDGAKTVKVLSTADPGSSGPCYVLVTGICSWEDAGGQKAPVIIATQPLQVMLPAFYHPAMKTD